MTLKRIPKTFSYHNFLFVCSGHGIFKGYFESWLKSYFILHIYLYIVLPYSSAATQANLNFLPSETPAVHGGPGEAGGVGVSPAVRRLVLSIVAVSTDEHVVPETWARQIWSRITSWAHVGQSLIGTVQTHVCGIGFKMGLKIWVGPCRGRNSPLPVSCCADNGLLWIDGSWTLLQRNHTLQCLWNTHLAWSKKKKKEIRARVWLLSQIQIKESNRELNFM